MSVYQENWFQSRSKKNSIFLHLSNYLWEIFYKSNYRGLFSVFPKPHLNTQGSLTRSWGFALLTWVGIEPTTSGLDHRCSIDWATRPDRSRPWEFEDKSAQLSVLGCCIRSSWCCGLAKVLHPSHVQSSVGLTSVFFRIHIHTLLRTTRTCT